MKVDVCSRAQELLQQHRERKAGGDGTSLAAVGADLRAPPRHHDLTFISPDVLDNTSLTFGIDFHLYGALLRAVIHSNLLTSGGSLPVHCSSPTL